MSDTRATLAGTIDCRNLLGEGVVWDGQSNRALWIDIEGRALYRSSFPFETFEQFPAPQRIGSLGLLAGRSSELVVAFESGFALFAPETGAVHWLHRPALPPGARFNDGRVDRHGTFWAGTMIEDRAAAGDASGALYRLRETERADKVLDGIGISNSLCWSPDGTIMYFADTPRDVIWAFDVRDGEPVDRRVFARTSDGAHPDGSTVDADGYLWNAQWGAGQVARYAPDGRLDLIVEVPAPQVSCVCFAGPSLDHLLVTSARVDLDGAALTRSPQSGSVFVYTTPFRGLPESRCAITAPEQH